MLSILKRILPKKNKPDKVEDEEWDISSGVTELRNMVMPNHIQFNRHSMEINMKMHRIFKLTVYPTDVYIGWLDEIYTLGDVDISIHIKPIPDRSVIMALTKKVTEYLSQFEIDRRKGNILRMPILRKAIAFLEGLRDAVQSNEDKVFHGAVYIMISANTEDELNANSQDLEDILARRNCQVRVMSRIHNKALMSVLPFGRNQSIKGRSLTLGGVAGMMQVTGDKQSHSFGVEIGVAPNETPVFLNSFDDNELPNPHAVLLGYSGSGKTFLLNLLAGRSMPFLIKNVFIDPEGKHKKFVEAIGGTYIHLDPYSEPMLNPFEKNPEKLKDGRVIVNLQDTVSDITGLICTLVENRGERVKAEELSLIERVVLDEYKDLKITTDPESLYEPAQNNEESEVVHIGYVKKKMPTLSSFVARLREYGGDRIATFLEPTLKGKSLGYFDGQSKIELKDQPLLCFDVSSLKNDFQRMYAMYVLLTWLWNEYVIKMPGPKRIIFDEGHLFTRSKYSANFLDDYGRRGRKHKLCMVIASQMAQEFDNEAGEAILGQCSTFILLRQNPTYIDTVKKIFKLSDGAAEYISTAGKGEGLLLLSGNNGNSITPIQVRSTAYELPLLSPDEITGPERRAS